MPWLILLGALAVLAAVIVIRTLCFKPEVLPPVKEEKIELDRDKIVADMADMIRCKTVSNRDEALVDRAEFASAPARAFPACS